MKILLTMNMSVIKEMGVFSQSNLYCIQFLEKFLMGAVFFLKIL